jgi:hypothetical protein
MSKKAIIELELKADGYKADVAEIQKANTTISESATKAANQATEAYTQTGKAAKAAFASTEVQKALTDQNNSVKTLTASLDKLYQEEVELLSANKQATEAYRRNREEADKLRAQIANLTKQTDQYNKATDNTEKKAKSLTGQLRAMKQELALLEQEGKDGTAEFNKLATAAARLEDQIGDTRERVRVLASDTFAFDVAVDATQNLAGAFSAVQGAVGLFTDDNEALQKTIAKTNSALALLNGLQQINAFVTGQSAAKLAVLNAAQRVNTFVTGAATVATKAWRAALVATGIGAAIALLGTLASKFIDVSEATDEAAQKAKEYQDAIDEVNNGAVTAQTRLANARIEQLRLEGKLSEQAAKNLLNQNELTESILQNNTDAKKKETEAFKRFEEQKAEDVKNFGKVTKTTTEQLYNDLRAIEFERAANEKAIRIEADNEVRKSTEKKKETTVKAVKEEKLAYQELNIELSKNLQLLISGEKVGAEAGTNAELDRRKRELAELEELEKEGLEVDRLIANAKIKILLQEQFIGIQAIKKTAKDKLDTVIEGSDAEKKVNEEKQEAILLLETTTANAINDINRELVESDKKAQEEIVEQRKKAAEESTKLIFQYADAFTNLLTSLNDLSKQQTENRINDLNAQQQKEIDNINSTFQTETQKQRQREAAEFRFQRAIALEKQKQAIQDKKLALLSATVNTAKAVVAALPNIPLSILIGIAGAAQIAAIASQPIPKFEKGGMIRGKRHREGGTFIEAEDQEFVVNRGQTRKHLEEVTAINRSTAEFHRLLERKYIQPRIASILSGTNRRSDNVVVNATLNSRTMEGEIKGLRKDIRRSASKGYKLNQTDTRYQWQRN